MLIGPAANTERCTSASTLWIEIVTAIDTPTAVPLAVVSPVALVVELARCCAVTSSPPVSVVGGPVARYAVEVIFEKLTEITGVTAVPSVAFAPFSPSVTRLCPPLAPMVRLWAPAIVVPSPTDAATSSRTMDTAIERPRPNFAPVAPAETAFVVETESGSALIVTSPVPPERVMLAPLPTDAVLDASTRLTASEPATLFLPPPAPEVDCAPKVLVESGPTVWILDSMVRDPAVIVVPLPIDASVVTKARFTPMAAPTLVPVAGPVVVAEPSAVAVESVLPLAVRRSALLPALRTRPPGMATFCEATLMVTAMAAATCTGLLLPELSFSDDSALGVAFAPETLLEPPVPPTSPAFF